MKIRRFLIPVGLVLVALAGAAGAQQVHTDYDKHLDFSQFHTYSWSRIMTENPLWQRRIQDAVDKQLEAKGWQRVDSGGDVMLTAVGAAKNQQEYQTFYNGFGPGWRWGGFGNEATTTAINYRVGTLVVDIYKAQTKELIWRGTSEDTLSDNPEKNEQKLGKAVSKMFDRFPPKGRG
jgi:hypothetical protein